MISGFPENDNQGTGSGFSFGGHYDATPTIVTQDAEFNAFDNAAIVDSQFVPNTPYGVAYAQSVNTANNDTDVYFEFIYPNVVAGVDIFLIGLSSVPATAQTNLNNVFNPNNAFIAFGNYMNYEAVEIKDGNFNFPPLTASTPSTGDVIRVELQSKFTTAAGRLTITNTTTNQELLNYGLVNNPLVQSLVIVGNVPIELTLNTANPMEQSFLAMPTLPEDAAGKTYRISNANEFSLFNGVLFTPNDFVTFFEDEGLKCTVSRLWTHQAIEDKVMEAIEASNNAILYNTMTVENPEDYSLAPVQADVDGTVIQYNDIQISINDSLPRTAVGVNFNAMATYKAGELFKITVQSNVEIPAFSLNSLGDSGFLPSLLANIEADSTVIFIVGVLGFDTSHYPRFTLMSKTVIS